MRVSFEADVLAAMRAAGFRVTPQRMMVVAALSQLEGHHRAPELLEQIQESWPYADGATLYRTLEILNELGFVSTTDMGGPERVYERKTGDGHHHLICRRCGQTVEIDHQAVRSLAASLLAAYGFAVELDHLALFGRCAFCQGEPSRDQKRATASRPVTP
jgi:Fur family ferric uptake transcriptional regulator